MDGGEPLLNHNTIFRLSSAFRDTCSKKGIGYNATIVTNATLLNREIINRLADEAAVSSFQITLEAGKTRHDTSRISRNGSPTYEQIVTIASFIIERCNLDIRINVDATSSIEDVEQVLEDLKDAAVLTSGRSSAYLGKLLYFPKNNLAIDARQLDGARYAALIARFLPYLYGLPASTLIEERQRLLLNLVSNKGPQKHCGAVSPNSMVIDAAGRLYKCWEEIGQPSQAVGYVTQPEFYDKKNLSFWLGSNYWKDPLCELCPILPICKGGCAYLSLNKYPKATYRCDFVFPVILSALIRIYAKRLFGEDVREIKLLNWETYSADIPL